jgi:hypothetical protein
LSESKRRIKKENETAATSVKNLCHSLRFGGSLPFLFLLAFGYSLAFLALALRKPSAM